MKGRKVHERRKLKDKLRRNDNKEREKSTKKKKIWNKKENGWRKQDKYIIITGKIMHGKCDENT